MKIKHLLTKTLLVAAGLLLGGANSVWAYEIPAGMEVKEVLLGTLSAGNVVAETFDEDGATVPSFTNSGKFSITDAVPTDQWNSLATSFSGKVLRLGSKTTHEIDFSSVISSGKVVFSADFYVGTNQKIIKFIDEDNQVVARFVFPDKNATNGRVYGTQYMYVDVDDAATFSSTPKINDTYQGTRNREYRITELVIDLDANTITYSGKVMDRRSSANNWFDDNATITLSKSVTIKGMIIDASGVGAETYYAYYDNMKLYSVGNAAGTYNYTINAVAGGTTIKQIAGGSASEGDEYSVYVPRVIEKNGEFYVWDEAETASNYKKSYTMGGTSEVREISYTKNANIVAYIEGESTAGTNEDYSNGSAGAVSAQNHLNAGRDLGTHPAGVYKFTVFVTGNYGRGIAVRNDAVDNSSNEYAIVRNEGTGKKEKTFVLPEERTLIVNGHWTEGTKTNQSGDFDYAILEYVEDLPATENIVVTSAGFATYVSNYNLDFTSATTKAYKVHVAEKGVATMTEVAKVPAKTPVLLYKEGGNGSGEAIPVTTAVVEAVTGNDLVAGTNAAVATNQTISEVDYTNMILNNISGNVGFYLANNKNVAANRAYLHFASSLAPGASAPMMLVFDGEATGIADVRGKMEDVRSDFFDLQGRKVAQPAKGLYIVNGKKVVIK